MRQRRFANKRQAARREPLEISEFMDERFKRGPELIFGGSGNRRIVQFGPGFGAKGGDKARKCDLLQ
jgi:hypothetical protein